MDAPPFPDETTLTYQDNGCPLARGHFGACPPRRLGRCLGVSPMLNPFNPCPWSVKGKKSKLLDDHPDRRGKGERKQMHNWLRDITITLLYSTYQMKDCHLLLLALATLALAAITSATNIREVPVSVRNEVGNKHYSLEFPSILARH